MIRRRSDRRPALLVYTAAVVAAGVIATAWAIGAYPIAPTISLTATGGREGILLGLVFWVALGLLGGLRIQRLHGHGVLTFHLPFILAATALGGPAAGAIVAAISTFEQRERREMPWYGLLSNHAALAFAAVLSGIVYLEVDRLVALTLPSDIQAARLVSLVAAGLTLTAVSGGLAAVTIMLRDGLRRQEVVRIFDVGHRTTAAGEVVLGWLMTVTYLSMGWWAASICALLVLVAWAGHDARELSRFDPLSGLLTRTGFDEPLRRAIEQQRHGHRSAVLAIDLDGFKSINDHYGHDMGDEVIRIVGERLRTSIRLTDAAVRRGGDEFSVLLTDLPDADTAAVLAQRIHDRLCAPVEFDDQVVRVGASIGVFVIDPEGPERTVQRVHKSADRLMYQAKKAGGGLRVATREPTLVA